MVATTLFLVPFCFVPIATVLGLDMILSGWTKQPSTDWFLIPAGLLAIVWAFASLAALLLEEVDE